MPLAKTKNIFPDLSDLSMLYFSNHSIALEEEKFFRNFGKATIVKFHQSLIRNSPPTEAIFFENGILSGKKLFGNTGRAFNLFHKIHSSFFLIINFIIFLRCLQIGIFYRRGRYSLCITTATADSAAAIILKKLGIVRYNIMEIHDYYIVEGPRKRLAAKIINVLFKFFLKLCIYQTDAVWLVSPYMAEARYLKNLLVDSRKPVSVFEITGCDIFTGDRASAQREEESNFLPRDIAYLGSLNINLGLGLVLDILPEIIRHIPDLKLRIIGGGPDEAIIRERIKNEKLEDYVILYGYISERNTIYEILSNCAVGLATYLPPDNFELGRYLEPSKVKTYMAAGLPVIITKGPYFADVIAKNEAGLVINYEQKELFDALMKFLLNKDMMIRFRANIKKLAHAYSYDKVLRQALETTFFAFWPRKSRGDDWQGRFREIISDPNNAHIPRVESAGSIENGSLVMHNGLRVSPGVFGELGYALQLNKGSLEPQEERVFAQVLPCIDSGGTMIELGAYWSFYSMWFYKNVSGARCYMIEADRAGLEMGERNFALNNMRGEFLLGKVGIHGVKVDDFIKEKDIKEVDILHADIQGYEFEMLLGAKRSIAQKRIKYFFISTHNQVLHAMCLDFLKRQGYEIIASADFEKGTYCYDGFLVAKLAGVNEPQKVEVALACWQPDNPLKELAYNMCNIPYLAELYPLYRVLWYLRRKLG